MFAHWGTFAKQASLQNALVMADGAMQRFGLTIWNNSHDNDYIVIGGNGQVIVCVACVPQQTNTWMVVHACSTDSNLAEQARNQIRTAIINMISFDDN